MSNSDDILAIQRCALDFAFAVAKADCAAIGACFAEDGRLTNMSKSLGRDDVETVGPAAVEEIFASFLPHMGFVHPMVQTRVLQIDGDKASAETMIQETMLDPAGNTVMFLALYDDELVRTDKGWKFARRTGVPRAALGLQSQVTKF